MIIEKNYFTKQDKLKEYHNLPEVKKRDMEKNKDKINDTWILIRNGEVRNVFKNRKEAVKYFKEILKQTLKDFDKQDEIDEYDYAIKIPETKFVPLDIRAVHLSLI